MKIKIEHGIPIPYGSLGYKKDHISLELKSMKVGDSFIWHGRSVSNIHLYAKFARVKIITRTVEDGKHRVWRVK